MSADAEGWVYRHSPYRGATFQVHHAIADSVNDQHQNRFWMKMPTLGEKARVDRGTAKRAVDQLVADGFLELIFQSAGGWNTPSEYRFLFPDVPVVFETREEATRAPRAGTDEGPGRRARRPRPARARATDAGTDRATRAPRAGTARAPDAAPDGATRAAHASTRVHSAAQSTQENPRTSSKSSSSEEPARSGRDDDDHGFDMNEALDGWLDVFAAEQDRPVKRMRRWKTTVLENFDDDHPDVETRIRQLAWQYPRAGARALGRAAAGARRALDGQPTRTDLCGDCDEDGYVEIDGDWRRCPTCTAEVPA